MCFGSNLSRARNRLTFTTLIGHQRYWVTRFSKTQTQKPPTIDPASISKFHSSPFHSSNQRSFFHFSLEALHKMACRRSITARAKLLYREQKLSPAFSHINHQNDDDIQNPSKIPDTKFPKIPAFLQNSRSLSNFSCSRSSYNHQRFSFTSTQQFMHSMNFGSNFNRNMSTGAGEGAAAVNSVDFFGDSAADVFKDTASTAVEAVSTAAAQVDPVMSEVAVAAADSFFPVAALQYMIDYVHTFTGLNWWGAIVVSTLLIRLATSPLVISQMKATSKFTLIRPRIEAIKEEMESKGMSPKVVAEGQQRIKKIFKEYGVSPLTPLRGLFVQAPIFVCFFLAITRMVDKVPSFREGGALWFTDLTTADSMYILPVLAGLTFWITVELNAQEGMDGNPASNVIKNVSRGFAVLTVPLTASFPQGIFFYWITSNIFSLVFGSVIKIHSIKKALGIPIMPVKPPTPGGEKPSFSFFQAIKKYADAQVQAQKKQPPSSSSSASQQGGTRKPQVLSSSTSASQAVPSSSIINQKIKSLERDVKGRKKGKKKGRV